MLAPIVALWHVPLVTTGQLAAVGIPITFAITLVYVWLFNRTGGSVLLTVAFHIAQGTFSYGVLGFTVPTPPGWTGSSACCGSPSLPR